LDPNEVEKYKQIEIESYTQINGHPPDPNNYKVQHYLQDRAEREAAKAGRRRLGMFDLYDRWEADGDDFFTFYHSIEEADAACKARKKEQGL
jgi:hypothetical protein